MHTLTLNRTLLRSLVAATLAVMAGSQVLAAMPEGKSETKPVETKPVVVRARPKIKIKAKPGSPHPYGDEGYDLWAREVVSSFEGDPTQGTAKIINVGYVRNIGTQDFVGSRKIYLTAMVNGQPKVLATKTLTSLKKNQEFVITALDPGNASSISLSMATDLKDVNSGNDYWTSLNNKPAEGPKG